MTTRPTREAPEDARPQQEGAPPSGRGPWGGPPGAEAEQSGPWLQRTFRSLGNTEFRFLWTGSLLAMGAMQMMAFAQGFYVYDLTGDPKLLGVVTAANGVPGLALSLFGGVFVDRWEKRGIIQVSQILFAIMAMSIATLIYTDVIHWTHLMVAAFIQGCIMPFMMPARQAIVPQVVPRHLIMNAAALSALVMSVTTMAAPAIAGPLSGWLGMAMLYVFIGCMNIASFAFTTQVKKHYPEGERSGRSPIGDIVLGVQYIRRDTVIMLLLIMGIVQVMMMAPIRFVMPLFARDNFSVEEAGLGFMLAVLGLGSMAGAIAVAGMKKAGNRGRLLVGSAIISGLTLLGFAAISEFLPVFALGLVMLAVVGLIQSARMTLQASLTLEYVDPTYRGRVMSIQGLMWGLMPIGVLPLTLIADYWGAPAGLSILALAFIAIATIVLIFSPTMRRLQ
ncbi:MAG: MFS transporter [Chloroflexi bacterium]|nr:MFS transporter [Chloroflexota bacterium]